MQPEGSSNNFEFFRWTKGWLWWSQYSNSSHNLFISINLSTVTDPGIPIGAPTLGWVLTYYYRLQWSWEGYGFTSVCLSTGGGGRWGSAPGRCLVLGVCLVLGGVPGRGWGVGITACTEVDPPGRDGYCCGRYASCWNAFLFGILFAENCMKIKKIGLTGGSALPRGPPIRHWSKLYPHMSVYCKISNFTRVSLTQNVIVQYYFEINIWLFIYASKCHFS